MKTKHKNNKQKQRAHEITFMLTVELNCTCSNRRVNTKVKSNKYDIYKRSTYHVLCLL